MSTTLRWLLYGLVAVAALAAGAGVVIGVQAFTSDGSGDGSKVDVAVRTSALVGDVSGLLRELQSPAVASDPKRRQAVLDQLADHEEEANELLAATDDLDTSDPNVKRLAATNRAVRQSTARVRKAAKVSPGAASRAAATGLKFVASYQDDAEAVADDLQKKKPHGPGATTARRLDISPVDLPHAPYVLRGGADRDYLGAAVDGAGDFDDDGVGDLLVAEPGRQAVSIVYGGGDQGERVIEDFGSDDATTISGLPPAEAGADPPDLSVAGAGDVNGDGLDDVAIGVPEAEVDGEEQTGSVFVVFGSRDREDVDADDLGDRGFRVDGPGAFWRVGSAITAGDLDDDGRSDIVIGGSTDYSSVTWALLDVPTPGADLRLPGKGAASGVWRINGVGSSLDARHDFNGDGRDDVVAGQSGNDGAPGFAAVVTGFDGVGVTTDATTKAVGVDPITAADGRQLGTAVASIADLDGDDRDEALVYSSEGGHRRAHVVFGTAASTAFDLGRLRTGGATVDVSVPDAAGSAFAIAAAGDMDGDGLSELAVTGPPAERPGAGDEPSYFDPGARIVSGAALTRGAHVEATGASGIVVPVAAFGVDEGFSDPLDAAAGGILAGVGDVDGDDLADLAVAAPHAVDPRRGSGDAPPDGEGALFVTTRAGSDDVDNPLAGSLTEAGLGDVRIGDAPDVVADALDSVARRLGPDSGSDTSGPVECGVVPTADARVGVSVENGEIGAISVSGPGISTTEGVEVGDEEAKVRRVYGDRASTTEVSPYETDVTVAFSGDRRLELRLDGDRRVYELEVGRSAALASDECA